MTEHKRVVGVVGTSFYFGAGQLLMKLRNGSPLLLKRQPENKYDKNAVAVFWGSKQLGHIPRGLAAELAPLMDAGTEIEVHKHGQAACVVLLTWTTSELEDIEANPTL